MSLKNLLKKIVIKNNFLKFQDNEYKNFNSLFLFFLVFILSKIFNISLN